MLHSLTSPALYCNTQSTECSVRPIPALCECKKINYVIPLQCYIYYYKDYNVNIIVAPAANLNYAMCRLIDFKIFWCF